MIDFTELLNKNNVQIVLTPRDLKEFAYSILEEYKKEYGDAQTEEDRQTYITASKAAEILHVDRSTLFRWNKLHYLVAHKRGRRNYYNLWEVKHIIDQKR